jgi:hypothetical protein
MKSQAITKPTRNANPAMMTTPRKVTVHCSTGASGSAEICDRTCKYMEDPFHRRRAGGVRGTCSITVSRSSTHSTGWNQGLPARPDRPSAAGVLGAFTACAVCTRTPRFVT